MKPDGKNVPHPQRAARILPAHLAPCSLSIVVFGPGRGEAIVAVLPDGSVGIVDGCREPAHVPSGKGDPVRELLDALRVEALNQGRPFRIRFVCLTHPHDDHYAGMGRLLEAFRGSVDAVWSVPKVGDRYAEALVSYTSATRAGRDPLPDDTELRGLERALAELTQAYQQHGSKLRHISQGKPLLQEQLEHHPLVVSACGPADADVENAHFALIEGVEHLVKSGRHDARFDPNATSGALLLQWGQAGVLLGGDLLCAQGRYTGWEGVCDDIQATVQVVKVAHHASLEAHHDALWKRLGARLAIVTPFKEAAGPMPPRPEQIARLSQDAVVAITSEPAWKDHRTNPRPLRSAPGTGNARSRTVGSARNSALALTPKSGAADIHNAVAVSLDASGKLVRLVLAGKADIYEPPGP